MSLLTTNLQLYSGTAISSSNTKATPVQTGHRKSGLFFIKVSASGGTGSPTLDVDIITYDVKTDDWYVIGTFTQLTTTGSEAIYIPEVGKKIAIQYAIADTNPTFTFKVSAILRIN